MPQVQGSFEVNRAPQASLDIGGDAQIGHIRFDKTFSGPLAATGVVHMLAVGTPVEGSAAYVAIERISGSLEGRQGSFFVQHGGTMDRGTPALALTIVPDSGTDALVGLRGAMQIEVVDGKHFYRLDYTLGEQA